MDFTINWTLSLGTDKVFYSFKVASCESTPNAPNQEINATNAIEAFVGSLLQEEAQ